MKRFLKFMLAFVLMMCTSIAMFAQGATEVDSVGFDIMSIFATFATLIATIPICVEFFRKIFMADGKLSGTEKLMLQIISWGIGLIITMLGWYFQYGFLAGLLWYHALIYGIGASLAANGVADTKIIRAIIGALLSLFKKKQ